MTEGASSGRGMFRNPLFRERALVRNAQPEPFDDLLRVTAPREWLLLAGLAVSLLVAVVWVAFSSVEQTLWSDGVFVHPGDRHPVASEVPGVVTEVTLQAGDRVEADQVIARLKLPDLEWRHRVARRRVALLEDYAQRPGSGDQGWVDAALAVARAEMIELGAIKAEGEAIMSPHAGEISASSLVAGQAVTPGDVVAEIRAGAAGLAPEAVTLVTPEQGRQIEIGMKARIAIPDRTGVRFYPAAVVALSPRPADLPAWLSRLGADSGEGAGAADRIVRLALEGSEDLPAPDGTACRVEIILARTTPLGLLIPWTGAAGRKAERTPVPGPAPCCTPTDGGPAGAP